MKKFLLVVCGSFVGVFLALTVFMISSIIFSVAIMSMGSKMGASTAVVEKNSLLHIELDGTIDERDGGGQMSMMDLMQGDNTQSLSLNTLITAIRLAKENDKIKGIYLDCKGAGAAPATNEALRAALKDFKNCGKPIYAYGYEGFTQGDYYLASLADSMFLNPVGAVDLHGYASATPYFKKLLDNLGIKMQIVRVGTFKSAVEPYMLEEMSEANRLQTSQYLGNIWKAMSDSIAADRKMTGAQLNQLVDSIIITMAPDSLVKHHLVDKLVYANEMEQTLKRVSGLKEDEDLRLVTPDMLAPNVEESASGDKIAVLYACGEIDGSTGGLMGGSEGIDSEKLCEDIKALQEDDDVKGLVLRVNSPGGSAFGSEQIWQALDEFKKSGKPFAVSMGDYAASGGYYISCGAQRIFAERTTITGSIGIFGMIPCYEEAVKNKLGVNIEVVKTNENADMGVMGKALTPTQLAAMQNMVNSGYDLFTKRCADGRHVTQDSIKQIAEGRVWDGISAMQHGLVDEFGGINDAVKWVAKKAGLKEGKYRRQNYPAVEMDWRKLLNSYMANQYEMKLKGEMGILYEYHKELLRILGRSHILCLMDPIEFN
ncbi:MAG: signal peptide peptidase SppA [Muribaculaceae bacterium]|nr:signal peptide peptidase SppA [Muribaculaceae bacterium]